MDEIPNDFEYVQVTVILPKSVIKDLELISKIKGINHSEVFRRALGISAYIYDEINQGNKFLIEKTDNTIVELNFND